MLRSCRRAAKHFEHVRVTWVRIVRSASMKIPKSRTHLTGDTRSDPTASGSVGSWLCRRAEAHHSTSIFDALSWSRLERIQSANGLDVLKLYKMDACGNHCWIMSRRACTVRCESQGDSLSRQTLAWEMASSVQIRLLLSCLKLV